MLLILQSNYKYLIMHNLQLIITTILSIVLSGFIGTSNSTVYAGKTYEWQNIVTHGGGCFPPNCVEGKFAMAVLPLVAFDGNLYSIGDKSVWLSGDGLTWNSQPKTDWGTRHGMRFAFFKNKLWMTGGMQAWDDFRNDVWFSDNGRDWKKAVSNAAWVPRRNHGLVVFHDKLWILGGALSSGRSDQTPTQFLSDVWSSEDGMNWKLVTQNAPWADRDTPVSLVFDNKMWIIGGGVRRDVWSSADGKNWTLITGQAPWVGRKGNGGLVFDGEMWIFGGMDLNDVWHSSNGKDWKLAFRNAPWSTRTTFYSIAFKNKLWLFSGKTGREDSWAGDIWVMSKKTE